MNPIFWIILIFAVLIISFISVIVYFVNFAVVRATKKGEEELLNIEFEPVSAQKIKNGIKWFKDQSPQRLWTKSYDGLNLAADYLPAKEPRGTIILVHGYRSSNLRDFSCVYEVYHNWNYNILSVHDRAHGDSDGTFIGFGILDRYDVLSWVNYVVENIGGNIFLDGLSMGASTVLMASGFDLHENVKGIIADCGFTSPWEECGHVLKKSFKLPEFPLLPICSMGVKLAAGYGLKDYSTLEALKTNKLPVLFIHGGKDTFVPTEMGLRNYEACTSEKELVLVDDAGHGESFLKDPEKCKVALKNFLEKHGSK
ncbi:MAG: alpha/beta hydrolase [Clostridia bacterium]|nr:alpha/beta hydrolase [Clostridia bacterium]